MAACGSTLGRSTSPSGESGSGSSTEAIQLQNVVRRTYQRPFTLDLRQATQQELAEAACLLDLPNHRFDDRLSRGIDRRARLRLYLARHAIRARLVGRQRAARACTR